MIDTRSEHSQISLVPGQVDDQDSSSYFSMPHHQQYNQEQSHPLQSNHDNSRYPPQSAQQNPNNSSHPYNNNYTSNNDYSNQSNNYNGAPPNFQHASPDQLEQLQLQKQHQQRLQEQINAEDSLRMHQHRVARPNAAAAVQDHRRDSDNKPASYYAYPPQPNASLDDMEDGQDVSFKARLTRLVKFPCSTYGKSLMLVIAIEALLVIIMQAIIVVQYFKALRDTPLEGTEDYPYDSTPPYLDPRNKSRSIPAYLIVFVFAQLFQLVLAWDAVRAQNTIEMIGIVIFNFCCFAYSIFEISQIEASLMDSSSFIVPEGKATELQTNLRPLLIVVIVIIGITQCAVTWMAYQLFQEFGWKIYKKIGADPNMKKMYRAYQIYLVLIKVDLFFFVGFSIQFIYLTLTRRSEDPEYWLTIIVLPLTIVILYIAVYAVRHESRRWMTTFIVAMLCGVAYFIFKVVRMYVGDNYHKYDEVRKFLTLFAALCLMTILATIANAAVCYRNFGKGLKAHIMKDNREINNSASSTGGRVLEID